MPQWNVNNIIPLINSYNVITVVEQRRPFIHPSGSELVKDKHKMYWIYCQTGSTEWKKKPSGWLSLPILKVRDERAVFFEHKSRVNCDFPCFRPSRGLDNVTHTWVIFTPLAIVAQNSFFLININFLNKWGGKIYICRKVHKHAQCT